MDNEVAKLSKVFELTPEELIQKAIDSGEGVIAKNGALSVETGDRTGTVSYTHLTLPTIMPV